ncbi:putative polygalacturonase [Dendrobium catenatum]|uniref:Putative polygalacturonase n=1 Tax=Dendrobium catenatum TaxID=906689 RepID=A0A2I0WG36_9ASPA|nr:putative polygalacturonase [Dendrobium catenatum]
MSGGIQDVRAKNIVDVNSEAAVCIKTAVGRGGFVHDIFVKGVSLHTMKYVFWITGNYGNHADDHWDPDALPEITRINYSDFVAENVTKVANLQGIEKDAFTDICISNVTAELSAKPKKVLWNCRLVEGVSSYVSPKACDELPENGKPCERTMKLFFFSDEFITRSIRADTIDNEEFFEDETKEIESDSLNDLNPELGKQEPLNIDTLTHPDPSLLEDKPFDKVCLDDSNVISKGINRTSNTLNLNLEDPDLVVTPTEMTPDNSDLILESFDLVLDNSDLIMDNSDGDLDNLELEVSQLNLSPDLSEIEPMDLRVATKLESFSKDSTLSDAGKRCREPISFAHNRHDGLLTTKIEKRLEKRRTN